MTTGDPPFDGKPCPCCPWQVRGLYAVAFNLLNLADDPDRWQEKIAERIAELRQAVKAIQPLIDAHFAEDAHSHGEERSRPLT